MGQSALTRNSPYTTSRSHEKGPCGQQKDMETERERERRGSNTCVSEWVNDCGVICYKTMLVRALFPQPRITFSFVLVVVVFFAECE